jgi:APA family basic amino acid/polyamine antiporter
MTDPSQRETVPEEPGRVAADVEPRGSLGLNQATALIVGSIIGVGIFNLPGSLAA